MNRFVFATLLSLGFLGLSSGPLFAQLGSYQRPQVNPYPTISPYVNMMSGGSAATNYFGIVRPQMNTATSLQQLQQQYQMIQGNQFPMLGGSMANQDNAITTGHPAGFMNYSFYFPLMSRGTGGAGANFGGLNGGMTGGMTGGAGFGVYNGATGTNAAFPGFNRR